MHIKELASALQVHAGRDECNDPVIQGTRGNIHEDGSAFSVYVASGTPKRWSAAKAKLLAFCTLRQDGDTEGTVTLSALPTPEQSETIRRLLKIRKIPSFSPETLEKFRNNPNLFKPKG